MCYVLEVLPSYFAFSLKSLFLACLSEEKILVYRPKKVVPFARPLLRPFVCVVCFSLVFLAACPLSCFLPPFPPTDILIETWWRKIPRISFRGDLQGRGWQPALL